MANNELSDFNGSSTQSACSLVHIFGMDPWQSNIVALDQSDIVFYIAGNFVVQFNIETRHRTFIPSTDGVGVGCICTYKQSYLLVGENGVMGKMVPSIYVRSFPKFEIVRRLQGGAEQGYACMDISPDGKRVVSIGMNPDNTLAIWDIESESIISRAKAFGQDVFQAKFSSFATSGDRIITSGTGHIRFWEMANTFTGVKLKGYMGKFGKIDMTDIHSFVELPNGDVLTGSESGHLLLWEANYAKCRFVMSNTKCSPAHKGGTFVVKHLHNMNMILTSGADGYLRWWDISSIEDAKCDLGVSLDAQLSPMREYKVHSDAFIIKANCFIDGSMKSSCLLTDVNGSLIKVNLECDTSNLIDYFHTKGIAAVAMSPVEYLAVTAGLDGKVMLWNISTNTKESQFFFQTPCSFITWIPLGIDESGNSLVIGFDNGALRILRVNTQSNLQCIYSCRPHSEQLLRIEFSIETSHMISSGKDEIIFIQKINVTGENITLTPIGCVQTKGEANFITLAPTNIFYTGMNGNIFEINSGNMEFLKPSKKDDYSLELTQNIVELPAEISSCEVLCAAIDKFDKNKLFLLCSKHESGSLILYDRACGRIEFLSKDVACDSRASFIMSSSYCYISFISSDRSIVVQKTNVDENDNRRIFSLEKIEKYVGSCLSFDDKFIVSTGANGLILVHRLFYEENTSPPVKDYYESLETVSCISLESLYVHDACTKDRVLDDSFLSLRDQRINETNAQKKQLVERLKEDMREKIVCLQEEFQKLQTENSELPEKGRLADNEMIVDSALLHELALEKVNTLKEVESQNSHETHATGARLKKLREKYVSFLEWERFKVKSLDGKFYVESFPLEQKTFDNSEKMPMEEKIGEIQFEEATDIITHNSIQIEDDKYAESTDDAVLSAFEKRKMLRQRRKIEIERKLRSNPMKDQKEYHGVDIDIGLHELKLAKGYVPTEADVDPEYKAYLIEDLKRKIYELKQNFNKKLHMIRCEKRKLRDKSLKVRNRLSEIASFLPDKSIIDTQVPLITVDAEEFPEDRSHVTKNDVIYFNEMIEACHDDPLRTGSVTMHEVSVDPTTDSYPYHVFKSNVSYEQKNAIDLSQFEKDEKADFEEHLIREKVIISTKIKEETELFNKKLFTLKHERCKIATRVNAGELQIIILQNEIMILEKDKDISKEMLKRKINCEYERDNIIRKTHEIHEKLQSKQKNIEDWISCEKSILKNFSMIVPVNHSSRELIFELYSSNEDIDLKKLNPNKFDGVSAQMLEQVSDLQRQRLHQEKLLDEYQVEFKNLKHEHQKCIFESKTISSQNDQIDSEILHFRRRKLEELNNQIVPSFLCLQADQSDTISSDFLLFPSDKLTSLQNRIPELEAEIATETKQLHKFQTIKSALTKDKQRKENQLQEQELKCNHLQMLKFGRLIDIDNIDIILENVKSGKQEADFEGEINGLTKKHNMEVQLIQSEIDALNEQLLNATNENTLLWKETAQLKSRKQFLAKKMSNIIHDKENSSKVEGTLSLTNQNEIQELQELVQTQETRIQNLKTSIQLLERKDGHINPDMIQSMLRT